MAAMLAKYWMTRFVFTVFPAPDSPLEARGTHQNPRFPLCSIWSSAHCTLLPQNPSLLNSSTRAQGPAEFAYHCRSLRHTSESPAPYTPCNQIFKPFLPSAPPGISLGPPPPKSLCRWMAFAHVMRMDWFSRSGREKRRGNMVRSMGTGLREHGSGLSGPPVSMY